MRVMRRLVAVCLVALALPALVHAASNHVVAAAKKTATAKSSTFTMSVTTSVAGQLATMTGSGAQRGTDVKLTMRTRAAGLVVRFDALLLQEGGGYVMYMRSPAFRAQLPKGKTWLRIDLAKQGANLGIDLSSLVSSSQTIAPLEKGLVRRRASGARSSQAGRPRGTWPSSTSSAPRAPCPPTASRSPRSSERREFVSVVPRTTSGLRATGTSVACTTRLRPPSAAFVGRRRRR